MKEEPCEHERLCHPSMNPDNIGCCKCDIPLIDVYNELKLKYEALLKKIQEMPKIDDGIENHFTVGIMQDYKEGKIGGHVLFVKLEEAQKQLDKWKSEVLEC